MTGNIELGTSHGKDYEGDIDRWQLKVELLSKYHIQNDVIDDSHGKRLVHELIVCSCTSAGMRSYLNNTKL